MNSNNNIQDLRNHLFASLDRLADPNSNLEKEIKRAEAMNSVSEQIINSAKVEAAFLAITKRESTSFIPTEKQLNDGNN